MNWVKRLEQLEQFEHYLHQKLFHGDDEEVREFHNNIDELYREMNRIKAIIASEESCKS
jgi:hypothetical protein